MKKLIPLITLVCFVAVGLISCDVTGEQNFEVTPGDSLTIVGPSAITLPNDGSDVQASYNSKAFTINKEYTWSVSGSAQMDSVYRQGEFIDVTFTETGTYTIAVDDGEYQGSLDVIVEEEE